MKLVEIKNDFDHKARLLSDVWTHFIIAKPHFKNEIDKRIWYENQTFTPSVGHFIDLLPIVFRNYTNRKLERNDDGFVEAFTTHIGFLQAVYVQQDLLEEMFLMLNLKDQYWGALKMSENMLKNRQLRNDIIGHPISRFPPGKKLKSMVLFSYEGPDLAVIRYLQYKAENGFKFVCNDDINGLGNWELVVNVQRRHKEFIDEAFEIIWTKIDLLLKKYVIELKDLDIVLQNYQTGSEIIDFDFVLEKVELLQIDYDKELSLLACRSDTSNERFKVINKRLRKSLITLINDTESTLNSYYQIESPIEKDKPLFED